MKRCGDARTPDEATRNEMEATTSPTPGSSAFVWRGYGHGLVFVDASVIGGASGLALVDSGANRNILSASALPDDARKGLKEGGPIEGIVPGGDLPSLGETDVRVRVANREATIRVVVVPQEHPGLLLRTPGRHALGIDVLHTKARCGAARRRGPSRLRTNGTGHARCGCGRRRSGRQRQATCSYRHARSESFRCSPRPVA